MLTVLVLDLNPDQWLDGWRNDEDNDNGDGSDDDIEAYLNAVCVFLNAQLSFSPRNSVICIGTRAGQSRLLYPKVGAAVTATDDRHALFASMNAALLTAATDFMRTEGSDGKAGAFTDISGAFSKALCCINKARQRGNRSDLTTVAPDASRSSSSKGSRTQTSDSGSTTSSGPRATSAVASASQPSLSGGAEAVLVFVSLGKEDPAQYFATMNAIFAAQKHNVRVDVCTLGNRHTTLQQAAHITGGVYAAIAAPSPSQLLQTLLTLFLGSPATTLLTKPQQNEIDFTAACMCHGNPCQQGVVCTVCLSIFCEKRASCLICGSAFEAE